MLFIEDLNKARDLNDRFYNKQTKTGTVEEAGEHGTISLKSNDQNVVKTINIHKIMEMLCKLYVWYFKTPRTF